MKHRHDWLPFDSRILPDIFSFKYPKSSWVRGLLVLEMVIAVLVMVGTLALILMPHSTYVSTSASSTAAPTKR
jgi:hypothetical protein